MTRPYALKRLLEHGELTSKEIEIITGWTRKQVWSSIQQLQKQGVVRKCKRMCWGLLSLNPMPY